jgi:hypothetical protein
VECGETHGDGASETLNCAININVIQPTPDISPCNSEKQLHRKRRVMMLAAPLASFGSATLTEPAEDARSIGSDSVFYNNDEYWLGSDDGTLCDSCSEDASSEDSDTDNVRKCSCCDAHARTSSPVHQADEAGGVVKQGPNVIVQCSNEEDANVNSTASSRELSSHSNNLTEVASSLVLDQLASNVDGKNNELITETVF